MALHISQATWASIAHPERTVTVTDIVQKIVDTKCGGRFLFIHREESKIGCASGYSICSPHLSTALTYGFRIGCLVWLI